MSSHVTSESIIPISNGLWNFYKNCNVQREDETEIEDNFMYSKDQILSFVFLFVVEFFFPARSLLCGSILITVTVSLQFKLTVIKRMKT